MPIDFAHDSEHNLLIVHMHGDVSDGDLLGYARQAVDDTAIDAGTHDYIDLSEVTSISATADGIRRFDTVLADGGRTRNAGRMAIVAPTDLTFGMARMFQLGRGDSPIDVQVFRAAQPARAWIGLPPAD